MKNRDMPANNLGLDNEGCIVEYETDEREPLYATGLTKREHFAGLAMQGMLSNNNLNGGEGMDAKTICEFSVKFSEDLLEALEKSDEST